MTKDAERAMANGYTVVTVTVASADRTWSLERIATSRNPYVIRDDIRYLAALFPQPRYTTLPDGRIVEVGKRPDV